MSINKDEYIEYVNKNKNLTECQKYTFMRLLNKRYKIYAEKDSNIQFKTYCKNALLYGNSQKMIKFKLMLNAFFNERYVNELVKYICNNNVKDKDVIKFIMDTNYKKRKPDIRPITSCDTWSFILQGMALKYRNLSKKKDVKYLDIGCGSGRKTKKFSELVGIDGIKVNVNGTDIGSWGPYEQNKKKFPFNFKFIKDGKLDYKDNEFDLITCFMMLHHVSELDDFIDEIKRILKPGGILLILEHTAYDDYDNMIIDLLHLLFATLTDRNKEYLKKPLYGRYYNWLELDFIFERHKIMYVNGQNSLTDVDSNLRYDNLYYSFMKNEK